MASYFSASAALLVGSFKKMSRRMLAPIVAQRLPSPLARAMAQSVARRGRAYSGIEREGHRKQFIQRESALGAIVVVDADDDRTPRRIRAPPA